MLELTNISKSFGDTIALTNVSLTVRPGEIHGVLGENGAGKSTLMNILFGLLPPDSGTIKVNGHAVRINSPRAQALGIGMVHQHFKLVPTLSVEENLLLALQPGGGFLRRRWIAEKIRALAAALKWQIDLHAWAGALTVGQQQRVEILKALATGGRVLILDEPTAVLTPGEVDELVPALESLAAGGTAILFISHKLAEVQRVCRRLSILRRGKLVYTGPAAELSAPQLAEKMVGAKVEFPRRDEPNFSPTPTGPAVLAMHHVAARGISNISLQLCAGEIVGIAGVDGNGQSQFVHAIVGLSPLSGGELWMPETPSEAHHAIPMNLIRADLKSIRWRAARIALIPEDRQRQGLVLPLTVTDNLALKNFRMPPFSTMGFLRQRAWRTYARRLVKTFDIRTDSIARAAGALSGGNQQKLILAREFSAPTPLVLAMNPTRGLDVGATAFVMRQLLDARRRGAGVLLIHSDLDELLAISDRVLVMFNGTLRDSGWPNASAARVGQMMLGAA